MSHTFHGILYSLFIYDITGVKFYFYAEPVFDQAF